MTPLPTLAALLFLASASLADPSVPMCHAAADSTVTPSCCPSPVAASDRWGLQFGVGSSFTLRSASGSTLSLVRELSLTRRLSLGLIIDCADAKQLQESRDLSWEQGMDTTQAASRYRDQRSQVDLTLTTQYQWLTMPRDRVRLVAGLGPKISYSIYDGDQNDSRNGSDLITRTTWEATRSTHVKAGLLATLGTEWDFARSFALQASYSLAFTRSWNWVDFRDSSASVPDHERQDTENLHLRWDLESPEVLLSLLVFF